MDLTDKDHSPPCWLWTGTTKIDGYGEFHMSREEHSVKAHRAAYRLFVGPIPTDHEIHHVCEVRHCVNPQHLLPVTRLEHRRLESDQRTHCFAGHELTAENTYYPPRGGWVCRECTRVSNRRYKARKRAQRAGLTR